MSQPEALRLAKELDAVPEAGADPDLVQEAAAELRRQHEKIERLKAELETERLRLAACGVVAMANTPESAARARQMDDAYRSGSLSDVIRAVDEEMRLRALNAEMLVALRVALPVLRRAAYLRLDEKYAGTPYQDDPSCQEVKRRYENVRDAIAKAEASNGQ